MITGKNIPANERLHQNFPWLHHNHATDRPPRKRAVITYHGSGVGRHASHDAADVFRDFEHVGDCRGIEQLVLREEFAMTFMKWKHGTKW